MKKREICEAGSQFPNTFDISGQALTYGNSRNNIFMYFQLTRLQSKNKTDIRKHNNFKDVIIKNFYVRKQSEKKISLR